MTGQQNREEKGVAENEVGAPREKLTFLEGAKLSAKGFCMGIADVIPGVSGGTMALILGIYVRFIEALKSLNLKFVGPMFGWMSKSK